MTGFTKFTKRVVTAGLTALALTSVAHAGPVLLYDDYVAATDTWGLALAGLGLDVTRVTTDAAFNAAIGAGYDLVVVQFDARAHNIGLASYLDNGGKLIYSNWIATDDVTLGVTRGASNQSNLTITSSPLSAGLSNAGQALVNDVAYPIAYSYAFSGGTSLATLGGGSGIVSTHDGQVIVNGFLGNTVAAASDEVRLYQNEVNLINAAADTGAVPEPSTCAIFGLGLALVGALTRKRRA